MASSSSQQSSSPWPPNPAKAGPTCVVLGRVALVHRDNVHLPTPLTVRLAATPRASSLSMPLSLHPVATAKHDLSDKYPYVLAAGDAGLLLYVSLSPSIGFHMNPNPPGILLVAEARHFHPSTDSAAPAGEVMAAPVLRLPTRNAYPNNEHDISNIRSVGLVSRPGSGGADYIVAELRVPDCSDLDNRPILHYFRSGSESWGQKSLTMPGGFPVLYVDDVVAHDGKLWWVDLASGLLGCDPFANDPVLRHVPFQFTYPAAELPQNTEIETRRMVRVSQGKLRFVELACASTDQPEKTLVVIWTLVFGRGEFTWWQQHRVVSLATIWESDRYIQLNLAEEVPELALLHPGDPDQLYFFLNRNLFSVNVHERMIEEYVDGRCNLVEMELPPVPIASLRRTLAGATSSSSSESPPHISWRYVLHWELPPSIANVVIPDKDVPFFLL